MSLVHPLTDRAKDRLTLGPDRRSSAERGARGPAQSAFFFLSPFFASCFRRSRPHRPHESTQAHRRRLQKQPSRMPSRKQTDASERPVRGEVGDPSACDLAAAGDAGAGADRAQSSAADLSARRRGRSSARTRRSPRARPRDGRCHRRCPQRTGGRPARARPCSGGTARRRTAGTPGTHAGQTVQSRQGWPPRPAALAVARQPRCAGRESPRPARSRRRGTCGSGRTTACKTGPARSAAPRLVCFSAHRGTPLRHRNSGRSIALLPAAERRPRWPRRRRPGAPLMRGREGASNALASLSVADARHEVCLVGWLSTPQWEKLADVTLSYRTHAMCIFDTFF